MTTPDSLPDEWRVNNFDLVRLLAALQVALVHATVHLKPSGVNAQIVEFGYRLFPGVPIFFVVSGFLISRSFELSVSIGDYYRNRCLRIFPAMWICLVISAGAILACGAGAIGTVSTGDWLFWWAAQMSAFQAYSPLFLKPIGVGELNFSLWTIPIELEFYLLLPGIYSLLRLRERRGNASLLTVLAASVAIRLACSSGGLLGNTGISRLVIFTIAPHLWMFLLGVLAQRNWNVIRCWLADQFHWWFLGYLLVRAVAARFHIVLGSLEINPILLMPLAGVVISGAMSARALADRILRHNDISYGTYIYHMLVVNLMVQFGAPSGTLSVVATLVGTLGLAILSWRFVELPFLARKHRSMRTAAT